MNKKLRERQEELIKKIYTLPKLKKWGTVSQLTQRGGSKNNWLSGSSTPLKRGRRHRPKKHHHKKKWALWFF